jgi:primary-amine oxidase
VALQFPDVRTTHSSPLAPLSAEEIGRVSAILREERDLGPRVRFVSITLQEPPKREVLDSRRGDAAPLERAAVAVLYDRGAQQTIETVVSLSSGVVTAWRVVEGVQPGVMLEEFFATEEVTRADARWQEAMRKRGVTDFSLAMIDPWAAGYDIEDPLGRRLIRPLTFVRSREDDNGYARPVEGLVVLVDLDLMEVIDVRDHGVVPLPGKAGNYMPELMFDDDNRPAHAHVRTDVRPIEITQPDGPSFTVDGHAVSWQKWRLQVGYTPREGLVLHQVGYEDRGRLRPVIYRASLSEMYIPYADPAPTHRIKNVFDEGEYGVGLLLNPLQLGCDCLGEIHYFDAVANDQDGQPLTIPNAICMHEEDFGVGWKHTDFRTEKMEVRRSRRLVISCFATVGNYEYGFFWYLYTDGTIQFEVKLTGVISTGAVPVGEQPRFGTLVAPGLYGPHHQHFFNVRLDMQVDGERNSVYEVDAAALPPGEDNPYGNAWVVQKTLLGRESEAQRLINPFVARTWQIVNPSSVNELGQPAGYKLMPGDNVLPLQQEGSQAWDRAQFAYKHLWVTAYDQQQMYAAGDYPNQSRNAGGLPEYVKADRSLEDADVVVWYSFGAHHVVRPEDWPVMPVSYAGFHLKPVSFFDGNPALDMPRSTPACHAGGETSGDAAAGDACCGAETGESARGQVAE